MFLRHQTSYLNWLGAPVRVKQRVRQKGVAATVLTWLAHTSAPVKESKVPASTRRQENAFSLQGVMLTVMRMITVIMMHEVGEMINV